MDIKYVIPIGLVVVIICVLTFILQPEGEKRTFPTEVFTIDEIDGVISEIKVNRGTSFKMQNDTTWYFLRNGYYGNNSNNERERIDRFFRVGDTIRKAKKSEIIKIYRPKSKKVNEFRIGN